MKGKKNPGEAIRWLARPGEEMVGDRLGCTPCHG